MESYSVEAILSAVDKNFTSTMKDADKTMNGLDSSSKNTRTSILDIAKGVGVFKVVQGGITLAKNAIVGLGTELSASSATWKTFTGNMENLGKSKSEIASVKKELQDFATQTIYSASDMATTYSQLEAVGIKSSNKLVKGFGGLAAAAENPKQAMKTLSQQATQMAAKPTVQWMDFKLMLEQTPAGMAAVAKTMGLTTSELVKNVQDGTVKTQEFFDAVAKTGTNETFGKMATEYKTVGQAMDGLSETLVTKLQPAFDKLSGVGIKAVEGIIGKLEKFDFDKLVSSVSTGATKVIEYFNKIWESLKKGLKGFDMTGFKKVFETIASVAKVAFGVILAVLPTVVEWVGKLATFFSKVVTAIQPFLPILIPIFTAWAAFMIKLKGISTVIRMFNTFKTVISGVATTFKILTSIMAANPFVLIVGAIVGLVAAFIYFWNTSEKFRDFWIDLWEKIKEVVKSAVDWIKDAWSGISEWFSNLWSGIKETATKTWNAIKEAPGKAAEAIKNKWTDTKQFFVDLWTGVKEAASNTWAKIVETIAPYITNIKNTFAPLIEWFSNLWANIQTVAASAWEIIKSVVMAPILFLIDIITGNFDQLKQDMAMIWQTISENALLIFTTIKDTIANLITALLDVATNLWTNFKNATVQNWNNLKESAVNIWTGIKDWFSNTISNIVSNAKQSWQNFKQGTVDIFNAMINWIKSAWSNFKTWLANLITSTVDAAKNAWQNLKDNTVQIFNNIVDGARKAWESLKQGVSDMIDKVVSWFDKIKDINLWEAGKKIMSSLFDGLKEKWSKVQNFVGGIGDWIREHKGPIRVDKKLLIPAGSAIMDSLNQGLINGFKAVKSNIYSMNDELSSSFDTEIGSTLARANSGIQTTVQHEVNYGSSNKPVVFNIRLGESQFKAFVDDISRAQGGEIDLNMQF